MLSDGTGWWPSLPLPPPALPSHPALTISVLSVLSTDPPCLLPPSPLKCCKLSLSELSAGEWWIVSTVCMLLVELQQAGLLSPHCACRQMESNDLNHSPAYPQYLPPVCFLCQSPVLPPSLFLTLRLLSVNSLRSKSTSLNFIFQLVTMQRALLWLFFQSKMYCFTSSMNKLIKISTLHWQCGVADV